MLKIIMSLNSVAYSASLDAPGPRPVHLSPVQLKTNNSPTESPEVAFYVKNGNGAVLGMLDPQMSKMLAPLIATCSAWGSISETPFEVRRSKSSSCFNSMWRPKWTEYDTHHDALFACAEWYCSDCHIALWTFFHAAKCDCPMQCEWNRHAS